MSVNGLPIEILIVLLGIAAVITLWLALRFGRVVALAVLVLGVLTVAVLGTGALFTQASANRETARAAVEAAKAAKAASVGQSISLVIVGLLIGAAGTMTVGALGVSGYAVLRWKLAERAQLVVGQRHRALPAASQVSDVFYVVEEDEVSLDLSTLNLEQWGW